MDAGPKVKVLVENKNKQAVMEQFLKVFEESKIIASDIISSGVEIIK